MAPPQDGGRDVGGERASSVTTDNGNMQPSLPPSQPSSHQKKVKDKKIFSCHSCRRRKLKCDRSDPCGACQARGEGHLCTWEEGQRPEKSQRESLEKLPKLMEELVEEVKQLRTSNLALMDNIKSKPSETSTDYADLAPDTRNLREERGFSPTDYSCWGSESSPASLDSKHWTSFAVVSLLPDSGMLWGLISHYIHTCASLTGFVDLEKLVRDVEEAEQVRQDGLHNSVPPASQKHFNVKVALILACISLAAADLDPAKADELGLGRLNVDSLVRELWRKSWNLITPSGADLVPPMVNEFNLFAPPTTTKPGTNEFTNFVHHEPAVGLPETPLRVVAIKIILLLAARSFATPSEYLKLHLDIISSAVEASLDSPNDRNFSLKHREWRWQLWSFLCVLDWTSPGIYHNGSYFIRSEMYRGPPSKIPGVPDDATYQPAVENAHWDRMAQLRHYLQNALALGHLSRRAEDYIIRAGNVSPGRAAELCAEIDALDSKLSFYSLVRTGAGHGVANINEVNMSGSALGGRNSDQNWSGYHFRTALESSHRRGPRLQHVYLSLELSLIKFKLFRHEAFHIVHENASTSEPLRTVCIDACMDACILVLSQCRAIARGDHGVEGGQENLATDIDEDERRNCTGTLRRVLQPASSAALVGQVLLHALQPMERPGVLTPKSHPAQLVPMSSSETNFFTLTERPMETHSPYSSASESRPSLWSGQLNREKVRVLQWHIGTVNSLLEELQATSSLARYKLSFQSQ